MPVSIWVSVATTQGNIPEKIIKDVIVPETITVQELANRMAERSGDVIKCLMNMGVMATVNQSIDADTAELVIHEFGHKIKRVTEADIEEGGVRIPDDIGLAGFNGVELLHGLPMQLATMDACRVEIGERAAQIVADRVLGNETKTDSIVELSPVLEVGDTLRTART